MDRLLFLVARDQPDLWDQLNKEFSGRDVAVVVDRRRGERRRAEGSSADNRRQSERRESAEVDREVRSRGFSVIRLDGAAQREGNPRAVRTVQSYIQEQFRHFTTVTSWDARREGQTFVIFNGAGRPAHRVLFDREFLDYYGSSMADRIPSVLDEWKLMSYLESVGSQLVVVSSYGVRGAER
jgi:hypothetical protein